MRGRRESLVIEVIARGGAAVLIVTTPTWLYAILTMSCCMPNPKCPCPNPFTPIPSGTDMQCTTVCSHFVLFHLPHLPYFANRNANANNRSKYFP